MSLVGDIKDVGDALWEVGKAGQELAGEADTLARGLKGLGNLFERFSPVGRLADLAKLGRKLSNYADDACKFLARPDVQRFLKRANRPILSGGQKAIGGMKLTTGFGAPEDGARFGEGAARFQRAGATLSSAHPDDCWSGRGSGAYGDANERQVGRVRAVSAADQEVNAVLTREANQIVATRTALDDQGDWLADVGLVSMLVAATPYVGQGAALAMEIAAVTRALGVCTTQLVELTQQVNANAAEIHQTADRYQGVTGLGTMSRGGPSIETLGSDVPPPSEPTDDGGMKPGDEPGGESSDGEQTDRDEGSRDHPGGALGGTPGGGSAGGGASRGSGSGGAPASDVGAAPADDDVPASDLPSAPASPPAGSVGSGGGMAPPMGAAPAAASPAAAGALPAATAAGVNAAQLASLIQSAVQQALNQNAEQKAKDEAGKDSDRDGVPDVRDDSDGDGVTDAEDDENRDGVLDVEQDTDGDGKPDAAGAGPGAPGGERAPVDPERPVGDRIGSSDGRDAGTGSTAVAAR
ncbi:EspA/EspE family type VII secretion system effector [Mycolicibacterium lacusdiani]|uniref:EspA/EspE family type VII secretion system effector n=1 Tax=Mycolicibacterium lacusdiani TaxID=2895283 RepID=UPI001F471284|nr:EspA/EspE family type VII secretion system effector [Mycolicibacterium lacusdiani]